MCVCVSLFFCDFELALTRSQFLIWDRQTGHAGRLSRCDVWGQTWVCAQLHFWDIQPFSENLKFLHFLKSSLTALHKQKRVLRNRCATSSMNMPLFWCSYGALPVKTGKKQVTSSTSGFGARSKIRDAKCPPFHPDHN